MRVLVTGASGMLGRAAVMAFADRGDTVTVLQRGDAALDARQIRADIGDRDAVLRAVADVRDEFDTVVHLAAKVSPTGSWPDFVRVNVDGTRTMLDAAAELGASRFVHVSTPSVAHRGEAIVGADADPADPASTSSHYARSKALAEELALARSDADLAVVAVRPHLVWGPGDTQLVGRIVERARSGRLALVGSGLALVDSTYVDNAADALVAAADRADEVAGAAYVVSNGEPRPIGELVTRIIEAAGVSGPRRRVPLWLAASAGGAAERLWERQQRSDDPPMTRFLAEQMATAHWFDQRRTRRELGWQPRVSLDEGFSRLARWFSQAGE